VTLVVFPDAMLATLEVLRDRLPAYASGVVCGTLDPKPDQSLPYVRVRLDATFGRYPVAETATVRLLVHAASEAKALSLAQTARAVLLAYEGGAKARSFGRLTGPFPTTDPDTGSPVAFLTVAARLRPTTL
jgi:hypothetical protein